jgi:hypothetical protein
MTEEQRDRIQDAADEFAQAIQKISGDKSRVGVFYNYLDNGEWVSGDAGNMNWMERIGTLEFLINLQKEGNESKL